MKARIVKSASGRKRARRSFVHHGNVFIKNGKYGHYHTGAKGVVYEVFDGNAVTVKEVLTDIDTCEKYLVLEFLDVSGQKIELEISRAELTELKIQGLVKFGIQVNKYSAITLIHCIENSEAKAPISYQHTQLGFGEFQDISIFKGYEGIGIESRYSGDLEIQPKGDKETWLDMVRNHVIGTPLEVLFAMGLSATMIDFIHRDFPVENLLVSLTGTSTTGKSTGLMFAVSMGAIPSFAENSFMLSFLDTELSLIHRIPSGYPVGIDEVSLLQKNSTKLLYSLGNGKERGRLRKDITMRESKEFHTAIFMSGEQSILQMADSTAGLRVRVMEFYNVIWTKSAESADCIKRICQNNYGWIVPLFADFLLKADKAALIESCMEWSDKFMSERRGDSKDILMARMSKKVGVILATAELAEQAIGVRINVEYVRDFLLQNLMTDSEEFDIGLKAYGEIISFMVEHPLEFGQAMNTPPEAKVEYFKMGRIAKGETVTLYDGRVSNSVLYISKEAFTRILEQASFKDVKIVLRRLKELNLLVCERDRYISTFKLGVEDVVTKGYRIRIPNEEQEQEDEKCAVSENDELLFDDEIEWEEQ